jgi:hypothetical protein
MASSSARAASRWIFCLAGGVIYTMTDAVALRPKFNPLIPGVSNDCCHPHGPCVAFLEITSLYQVLHNKKEQREHLTRKLNKHIFQKIGSAINTI